MIIRSTIISLLLVGALAPRAACDTIRIDYREGATGNYLPLTLTTTPGYFLSFDLSGAPVVVAVAPGSGAGLATNNTWTGTNTFANNKLHVTSANGTTHAHVVIPDQVEFPLSMAFGTGGLLISDTGIPPLDPIGAGTFNGHWNTFFGMGAGDANTTGNYNTFIGSDAGHAVVNGTQNTFVGGKAGQRLTDGYHNTFIGVGAGQYWASGSFNTMLGTDAGLGEVAATSGFDNTFVGASTGSVNTGDYNSFLGVNAGAANTTGHRNTFLGYLSGLNNTTGIWNTAIGMKAGSVMEVGASYNTFLGTNSDCDPSIKNTVTNSMALGQSALITASNQVVIGDINVTSNILQGSIDLRGPTGTGAAAAGILTLGTKELTVVAGDQLGRINFNAPLESNGAVARLPGAAIWAVAGAPFAPTVNDTDMVFATGFGAAATEKVRIDSEGRIGINTSTPTSFLTVNGAGSGGDGLESYFNKSTYSIRGSLIHAGNSGGLSSLGGLQIAAQGSNFSTSASADIRFFTSSTDSAGGLIDSVPTPKAVIRYNGNLGIGTTYPDATLEVNLGTTGEQRWTYNDGDGGAATYANVKVASTGVTTLNAVGSAASFAFSDPVLLPQMTKAVRNALTAVNGMMVYQTDATPGLRVYENGAWVRYTVTADP